MNRYYFVRKFKSDYRDLKRAIFRVIKIIYKYFRKGFIVISKIILDIITTIFMLIWKNAWLYYMVKYNKPIWWNWKERAKTRELAVWGTIRPDYLWFMIFMALLIATVKIYCYNVSKDSSFTTWRGGVFIHCLNGRSCAIPDMSIKRNTGMGFTSLIWLGGKERTPNRLSNW